MHTPILLQLGADTISKKITLYFLIINRVT